MKSSAYDVSGKGGQEVESEQDRDSGYKAELAFQPGTLRFGLARSVADFPHARFSSCQPAVPQLLFYFPDSQIVLIYPFTTASKGQIGQRIVKTCAMSDIMESLKSIHLSCEHSSLGDSTPSIEGSSEGNGDSDVSTTL